MTEAKGSGGIARSLKRCLLCTLLLLNATSARAKVAVELEGQPISVTAAGYKARIEPDGCLTNLAVGGIEFFAPGVSISRGSYFYLGGPLKLSDVQRVDDDVVIASSDKAEIRYQFEDEQLTWTLTNKTDKELVFFIVLNGYVGAVSIEEGPLQKTPLNGEQTQADFFLREEQAKHSGLRQAVGSVAGAAPSRSGDAETSRAANAGPPRRRGHRGSSTPDCQT